MPIKRLSQKSFFSPEFADPDCIPEGSLPWLFHHHAKLLFPDWLTRKWHGRGARGRDAWPASVLIPALIMASREKGMSRRGMVRRLRRDTAWRAACHLEIGGKTPSEATFRRFERFLRARDRDCGVPRYLLLHEHFVRLCMNRGIAKASKQCFIDSTPMWCYGAIHGTLRLLGDGLRGLCKYWARIKNMSTRQLAKAWGLTLLRAKSVKGHFRIDWKDGDAVAGVVDQIARAVIDVVDRIRSCLGSVPASRRSRLLHRCSALLKIIRDDLETDDRGRLVIARKVATDRIVSINDPKARASRKSKSHSYKGFKVHVLGDIASGLILSMTVTPANVGDGKVAHRMIRRAKTQCSQIEEVLGDTAYGGAKLHYMARRLDGVDIFAPPFSVNYPHDRFRPDDFTLDLKNETAVCPAGKTSRLKQGKSKRYFYWGSASCSRCPLRSQCIAPRARFRRINVHPQHDELAKIRERWKKPEERNKYRSRSIGERLINEVVRRGCRRARAWGLAAATLQVAVAVMGCNLALLAKALAREASKPSATAA